MNSVLQEHSFQKENVVFNGNRFLIGNGYLGYRGTLDEFTKDECVGLNVAGLYDGLPGKWRETVNAFNPFYLSLQVGKSTLSVLQMHLSHTQSLNLTNGTFRRETVFCIPNGTLTLCTERFVSFARKNILCSKAVLTATADVELTLHVAVDPDIWDLNGPHLVCRRFESDSRTLTASGATQERGDRVTVRCVFSVPFTDSCAPRARIRLRLQKNKPFTLERIAGVFVNEEPVLPELNYADLFAESEAVWQKKWQIAQVTLQGDAEAEFALRYSIYHLLLLTPQADYSIAARGLSGQTYKGAVFWDTEMFLLPFYLATDPTAAKRLVQYRIDTLSEAKKKAAYYGYDGAFYAWESQNGYDACSDFNVVDVFTHRPVRTYFKDKQIHISAAVAYGILCYYRRTKDSDLLLNGGLEVLLECAEFFYSYSYYNPTKKRYELLDVIGPDEYHERVNNNAYTNYMVHFTAGETLALLRSLPPTEQTALLRQTNLNAEKIETLTDWLRRLYLPPVLKSGVIEQFDGYFRLEDVTVPTIKSRLVLPNEYWGGSTGVATATRVLKQADTVMLLCLLRSFDTETVKANYDFYLPYTEHGSSLSACMYALAACRIGYKKDAYAQFMRTATIDLTGESKQWAGEVYIGGTHPAANGGAWMTAIYGFAGLTYDENGKMQFAPCLPERIEGITFTARENDDYYRICVTHDTVTREKLQL